MCLPQAIVSFQVFQRFVQNNLPLSPDTALLVILEVIGIMIGSISLAATVCFVSAFLLKVLPGISDIGVSGSPFPSLSYNPCFVHNLPHRGQTRCYRSILCMSSPLSFYPRTLATLWPIWQGSAALWPCSSLECSCHTIICTIFPSKAPRL